MSSVSQLGFLGLKQSSLPFSEEANKYLDMYWKQICCPQNLPPEKRYIGFPLIALLSVLIYDEQSVIISENFKIKISNLR